MFPYASSQTGIIGESLLYEHLESNLLSGPHHLFYILAPASNIFGLQERDREKEDGLVLTFPLIYVLTSDWLHPWEFFCRAVHSLWVKHRRGQLCGNGR